MNICGKRKRLAGFLAGLMVIMAVFPAFGASSKDNKVAQASQGVVRIIAIFEDQECSLGSGFGVGKAGEPTDIFVTNWHVAVQACEHGYEPIAIYILKDNEALVDNYFDDTKAVRCRVLDTTRNANGIPDYAILQAEEEVPGRIALPLLERERVSVADTVYALGYPGNGDLANDSYRGATVEEVTVTQGIVSRLLDTFSNIPYEVIQHSAHINHGNSGGPLLNEDGAVVGINTYGFGDGAVSAGSGGTNPSEYSVAVSIDYVMEALDRLGISYDVYEEAEEDDRKEKTEAPDEDREADETGSDSGRAGTRKKTSGLVLFLCFGLVAAVGAGGVLFITSAGKKKQNHTGAGSSQPQGGNPLQGGGPGMTNRAIQTGGPTPVQTIKTNLKLKGVNGYFAGRVFAFSSSQYRLGTDPACRLRYPVGTKGISPFHCELLIQNGSLYLADSGSQFGTYLNSSKIIPQKWYPLKAGDVICLASQQEVFQVSDT